MHYNCTTVQNVRHSKKDWVINPPEKTRLLQKATTTLKNAAKS
ncbi:hypothetical protein AC36_4712 [Escherichia coli 4-203-08_S3_C2]|nr:hypothetical protein AC61_4675 [Escherichia coli 4-203-08_S3_C3]KEL05792.1 hypothetical protein AC36_4712 [Escherichia coli 4-203-08_S3_C2]KEL96576.1 hypothetical protein AC91_4821 [Escherichia coli 6-175-07_S4_C1]KEM13721.1 hypothetical protein AD20_4769 [Escherichia coli 6-175-07_S4_C2]KEM45100.1 hypothetical protein AD46_4538 [Escherichia coli 6-175-07_S4_C3]KEM86905.1 hypothetical protein AC92_4805 [Escherichia coli 6-537-08_S4_C1]